MQLPYYEWKSLDALKCKKYAKIKAFKYKCKI